MVTLASLYANMRSMLERSGIPDSRFEALQLLKYVTGFERHHIASQPSTAIDDEHVKRISSLLDERITLRRPLQYILGSWEFYGYEFSVGDGVLIPRPDTETLVDCALECLRGAINPCVADLCSGSGCIAVAIDKKLPEADVTAVELSDDAIPYLEKNIHKNNAAVKIIRGDVLDNTLVQRFSSLDCIVSNPPYVTDSEMDTLQKEVCCEPEMALRGGKDGLRFYREMTPIWKNVLKQGGAMLYETGDGQADAVCEILSAEGFSDVDAVKDTAGLYRVVRGIKI